MFAKATNVGFAQRVVATLVACSVVLWSIGVNTTAQAANLVSVSNTVTNSDPGATAAHSIAFTIPVGSGLADTDTITIDFSDGPFGGVGDIETGDITVTVEGNLDAHANFAAGATSISFNGIIAAAGERVIVAIADGIITNPVTAVPESYEIVVDTGATTTDTGKTRVAIIDNVLVTAIVNTSFDFIISGVATGTAINGTSTTGETSSTLINFGELVAGEIKTLGQRLNVTTNARNGFVVTVQSDGDLASANGAVIDNFLHGSDVDDTGTVWASPVPVVTDETTWGHWGLTSSDADLFSLGGFYSQEFAANNFIAASTTPREVFHHDGPSDGLTANIGSTTVAYQIEITPLQEAADDYNTTLTYIATPTF